MLSKYWLINYSRTLLLVTRKITSVPVISVTHSLRDKGVRNAHRQGIGMVAEATHPHKLLRSSTTDGQRDRGRGEWADYRQRVLRIKRQISSTKPLNVLGCPSVYLADVAHYYSSRALPSH